MPSRYALIPDQVWDGTTEQASARLAVLVSGSCIEALLPVRKLPREVRRVALPGCTLLPGLIDAHVHFCAWMGPAFLAAGVTTIRDVGNDEAWILKRRAWSHKHPLEAPRILCCGPLLDGPKAHWPIMGRAHPDRAAIEESVRALAKRGVDAIKLYANTTLDQMQGAASAAHACGLHCLAHIERYSALEAARAGVDELQHLKGCAAAWRDCSVEELEDMLAELLPFRQVQCPTLVVWDRIARVTEPVFPFDTRLKWVHPNFRWGWIQYPWHFEGPAQRLKLQRQVVELKRSLPRILRSGLPVIAGTDSPFPWLIPGFSLHDELALMVDGGLTPLEALRSATSSAAKVLRIDAEHGKIAPGAQADLLAVRGDPLRDIRAVAETEMVIKGGQRLSIQNLWRLAQRTHRKPARDPVSRDILGFIKRGSH